MNRRRSLYCGAALILLLTGAGSLQAGEDSDAAKGKLLYANVHPVPWCGRKETAS